MAKATGRTVDVTFKEQLLGMFLLPVVHGLTEEDPHLGAYVERLESKKGGKTEAQASGKILPGMQIVAIDGESTEFQDFESVIDKLKSSPRPMVVTFRHLVDLDFRDAYDFSVSEQNCRLEKQYAASQNESVQARD